MGSVGFQRRKGNSPLAVRSCLTSPCLAFFGTEGPINDATVCAKVLKLLKFGAEPRELEDGLVGGQKEPTKALRRREIDDAMNPAPLAALAPHILKGDPPGADPLFTDYCKTSRKTKVEFSVPPYLRPAEPLSSQAPLGVPART